MAKQLVRMFKILLLSTNIFTVHGKVSDLLFLKNKTKQEKLPIPHHPPRRAQDEEKGGERIIHLLRKLESMLSSCSGPTAY